MIGFCAVVRNEERNLARCFESVRGLAGEYIVVDTGSTDSTPRMAAEFGAKVVPFDFSTVDFAAARNCALAHASARWILMLDADETLDPAGVPEIAAIASGEPGSGYYLERCNRASDPARFTTDYVVRLFPNRPDYRFRGRVHETVDASILKAGGKLRKTGIRIDHDFAADPERRRRRNLLYLGILLEEIAADPSDDSRLDFLAAEYHQLGMFDRATEVAERIAERRPGDRRAHLFAGVYRLVYGRDAARAKEHFERALRLRPGDPETESFLKWANAA